MGEEKEKIVFKPRQEDRFFEKDGKAFRMRKEIIGKDQHCKKVIFEEVDEEEWQNRRDKLANYLVNESGLTATMVVEDLLKQMSLDELEKIEKQAKAKQKVRIKKGCIGLIIGRTNIEVL